MGSKEAAPKKATMTNNPCLGEKRLAEDTSTPFRRTSRRKLGKEPIDDLGSIDSKVHNQEVRRLLTKGGSGGKVRCSDDSSEWNYFPAKKEMNISPEKEKHNEQVFSSLNDIVEDTSFVNNTSEDSTTKI